MFTSKIFKVAYAITQAEGWFSSIAGSQYPQGSQSYKHHNPGNIRVSPYEVGKDFNFSVFENDMVGFYAIVHQLWLYASGNSHVITPDISINEAIGKYNGTVIGTPNAENYMKIIEQFGGVSRYDKISTLLH